MLMDAHKSVQMWLAVQNHLANVSKMDMYRGQIIKLE